MNEQALCNSVRERLLRARGSSERPADVEAHLAVCAACRAEAALDGLLARGIAALPAPAADLGPLVLERIERRPARLLLALQVAVLFLLGLSLAQLLPDVELPMRWPEGGWAVDLSGRIVAAVSGAGASARAAAAELDGGAAPPGLAAAGLVLLLGLNVAAARRAAPAGARR
jgi:predicted anti-sigma-YlaC factor YlaD